MWFITEDHVALAYLLLAALFALAIGVHVLLRNARRKRLLRRIHANVCHRCGYDLRANTHRCAECGAFIESTPERVHALAHVTTETPQASEEELELDEPTAEADVTETTPSTGSPPSPG
jgi:hypothetical protein